MMGANLGESFSSSRQDLWVANEICPLTGIDLPAVVTTGRG
jgi:hypothetical protein